MKKGGFPGMTFTEMLVALMAMGLVMATAVTLFAACNRYFRGAANRVDTQSSTQIAAAEMRQEIEESDPSGTLVGSGNNALLLISARDSANVFNLFYQEAPYWQKWVAYSLIPEPGTTTSELIRQEGNPPGMPALPSTSVPAPIPSNWLTLFQNSGLSRKIVALDFQTFSLKTNIGCTALGPSIFMQISSAKTYGGKASSFTPGVTLSSCSGGNWVEVLIRN